MFLSQSMSRALVPVLGLALATVGAPAATAAPATPLAPLHATGVDEVAGRYIVVLKRPDQGGPLVAAEEALVGPLATARAAGGTVRKEFTAAIRGFSADLSDAAVTKLREDPRVAYVQTVRLHQQDLGPAAGGTQPNAPWHLDRIDQRQLPLNNTYNYPDDAAGVRVYVLDSGVRATHTEFEGRAAGVYTAISDGNGTNDCANHGTFVSSHVAGKTYGAAKKASIKAVRILHCNGNASTEEIVDGMNWTAANAVKPAVANMSIQSSGGNTDQAMDDAARGMVDAGLLLVLIAGNFNKGDCRNSPKDSRAIIMAASTKTDARNTGSNASSYGSCVTAFAPGADVTGAGKDSNSHVLTGWYGTSFAAPLAAATVALALQKNAGLTMAQAKDHIINTATTGALSNIGSGSPNRLLYVDSGTPSPNPTVTNPGNQTTVINTAVSLQIQASDPQGDTLAYTATGLPTGLSINSSSGLISGTPTATGTSSVTVTATDPGNSSGSASFTWTVNPVGGGCTPKQLVGNPGFENGTSPWTGDTWTINSWPNQPAHSGSRVSWILGYGYSVTETIRQSIAIPSGCQATLTFYLHIDTAETGSTIYDRFSVKVGNTTLATYSNRDAAPGYVARSFNLSAYAGQTISLIFTGTENSSRQTSFTIDDVTLNIS